MPVSNEVEVGGHRLKLTNLDKVLYPKAGFTKAEVVDYYARIADLIVPHLRGRPLTLRRFPDGVGEPGKAFFEKRCPKHRPSWVKTARMDTRGRAGKIDFCRCDDLATLTWMAQLAALELHPSLARAPGVTKPTVLAFDLDPGPRTNVLDCCRVALRVRELFAKLGLECFPKTSGSKGLQVYVPLNTPKASYEKTKGYARAIAQLLEQETPTQVTSQMKKTERTGRVFVDWSQNDRNKTTIAVYSLRAREHPTVSTPISWKELGRAIDSDDAASLVFEAADVLKRAKKGDPFAPVLDLEQELPKLGLPLSE